MLAEPRKGRLEGWLHQAAGRVRGGVARLISEVSSSNLRTDSPASVRTNVSTSEKVTVIKGRFNFTFRRNYKKEQERHIEARN